MTTQMPPLDKSEASDMQTIDKFAQLFEEFLCLVKVKSSWYDSLTLLIMFYDQVFLRDRPICQDILAGNITLHYNLIISCQSSSHSQEDNLCA